MNANPVRTVNVPAIVTVIVAVAVLLMVTVVAAIRQEPKHPYSEYQTAEALKRQYTKCAVHAQHGFTCLMVPMMVSEQFALEEGNKQ